MQLKFLNKWLLLYFNKIVKYSKIMYILYINEKILNIY